MHRLLFYLPEQIETSNNPVLGEKNWKLVSPLSSSLRSRTCPWKEIFLKVTSLYPNISKARELSSKLLFRGFSDVEDAPFAAVSRESVNRGLIQSVFLNINPFHCGSKPWMVLVNMSLCSISLSPSADMRSQACKMRDINAQALLHMECQASCFANE